MNQKLLRDLLLLLLLFGAIWMVLAKTSLLPKKTSVISVEKEERIGEKYTDFLFDKDPTFNKYVDSQIDSIIHIVTDTLIIALGETEYDYHFYVFDHNMINAFTLPGGNVLISKGLLEHVETAEELAAVIAHEMGHVENRDVISKLIKELSIQILTSGDTYVLGEVTKIATSTSYDRKQEREADEFALKLLEQANIEPRVMATFFRRLLEEYKDIPEELEFLSTHPNLSNRIKEVLEYTPTEGFIPDTLDINWNDVKTMLDTDKDKGEEI